mgnify:CR=1 FL=1
MELQGPGIFDTNNFDNANEIVMHIEKRPVTNPRNATPGRLFRYHRLIKWQLKNRDLDEVSFDEIAEEVKAEMEDILNVKIPEFESEIEKICSKNND